MPSKVIICELTSRRDASFYEEIDVCLFLVKDLREVLYAQVVYPQLTVNEFQHKSCHKLLEQKLRGVKEIAAIIDKNNGRFLFKRPENEVLAH